MTLGATTEGRSSDAGDSMNDTGGPELDELYAAFAAENLTPLWTQLDDLMPITPSPQAVPHVWRWTTLYPLAQRAGDLVPVGRGGERRAIALANPGLPGTAYVDARRCGRRSSIWAPTRPRRNTATRQNAFRFVVEGEGVWTVVNGDPVAMRRGDFLLTPGWNFHGHHNDTDQPDGLDRRPRHSVRHQIDAGFFEFGTERVTDEATPPISRSERLWAHPGLRPLSGLQTQSSSPIAAYRWEHTDAALLEQLLLEDEGYPATVDPGHAAIRFTQPDHRRRRHADDPRRVPPAARRASRRRPGTTSAPRSGRSSRARAPSCWRHRVAR